MSPDRWTPNSSGLPSSHPTDYSDLLRHCRYIAGTHRQSERNVNADRRIEMTTNNSTWIRRVAAGAVLVAAPALIALGTASASHAEAGAPPARTSPSYAPTPSGSLND